MINSEVLPRKVALPDQHRHSFETNEQSTANILEVEQHSSGKIDCVHDAPALLDTASVGKSEDTSDKSRLQSTPGREPQECEASLIP